MLFKQLTYEQKQHLIDVLRHNSPVEGATHIDLESCTKSITCYLRFTGKRFDTYNGYEFDDSFEDAIEYYPIPEDWREIKYNVFNIVQAKKAVSELLDLVARLG